MATMSFDLLGFCDVLITHSRWTVWVSRGSRGFDSVCASAADQSAPPQLGRPGPTCQTMCHFKLTAATCDKKSSVARAHPVSYGVHSSTIHYLPCRAECGVTTISMTIASPTAGIFAFWNSSTRPTATTPDKGGGGPAAAVRPLPAAAAAVDIWDLYSVVVCWSSCSSGGPFFLSPLCGT